MVKYFTKRILANLSKPTSINAIYNDIKSQGLKVGKNDLYLWANYLCNIFLFSRISKYTKSIIKEQQSLDKYYCVDNGIRNAVLLPQRNDEGKLLENNVFCISTEIASRTRKSPISKKTVNVISWCSTTIW